MKKVLMTLAATLCIAGANAIELDCTFDKKQPAGVSFTGTVKQENGASVMVNDKSYYVGILSFTADKNAGATLSIEISTTGNPASQLGIILLEKQANGKLKPIKHLTWARNLAKDKYENLKYTIAPGILKEGQKYDIYVYRSNQKGTLKLKRINFKTTPAAK